MGEWHCDICNQDMDTTSKSKHIRSFKHILVKTTIEQNAGRTQPPDDVSFTQPERVEITQQPPPPQPIPENVVKTESFSLDDLRNDTFVPKEIAIPAPKMKKTKPKRIFRDDDNDSVMSDKNELFDDKGTHLFGKENLELLNKIKSYKQLFPKELSKFRIKKRATDEELKNYLEEIEILVNLGGIDTFIIDTILGTINTLEGFTVHTSYNISGMSMMLKGNPQFIRLVKQLYLKYNSFGSTPPELQMVLLVFTTAYLCINKNKNIQNLENTLNEPMTHRP
jgi:hypothetical protein